MTRTRSLIAAAVVVLLVAAVPAAAAAKAPAREELDVYVPGPPGHRHQNTLTFRILPRYGVAVAATEGNDEDPEDDLGVGYAVRIPKRSLDGRVDVRFPGLGRIVGRFGPEADGGAAACAGEGTNTSGHFVGRIEFRGSGGYHRWAATRGDRFSLVAAVSPPTSRPIRTAIVAPPVSTSS
jgi:hypothetical protein